MSDNTAVASLQPREVFSRFAELCAIPHGSGNEKALSDHILRWAQSRNLDARQDSHNNLRIAKPGVGCAPDAPTVTLQAHLDMVTVASPDYDFDFATRPITPIVNGDRLQADRTTLGADDGIGVAFALALLDATDITHPPLEVVLTTEEEIGLRGAAAFDASWLTGTVFINIDSEEEGIYYASCAGGARLDLILPAQWDEFSSLDDPDALQTSRITVDGLRGGHSGIEIDKERGNAHRILARTLTRLKERFPGIRLADITGGQADNAIPASASAVIVYTKANRVPMKALLADCQEIYRAELKHADGKPDPDGRAFDVTLTLENAAPPARVFRREVEDAVLFALLTLPTGVTAMDMAQTEFPIPETSSNLALVHVDGDDVVIEISIRSQRASKKDFLKMQINAVARRIGARVTVEGDYPGWEYDPDSRVRPILAEAYRKLTGKTAQIRGIHAGLECGIFAEKMRALGRCVDFTSIGPDLRDVHTPDESLGIASVGHTWELIKETLAVLAKEEC